MPNLPNLYPGKTKVLGDLGVHPTSSFMKINSVRMHWEAGAILPPNHHMPNYLAVDAVIENPRNETETLQVIRLSEDDSPSQSLKTMAAEIQPNKVVVHGRVFDEDWWEKKAVAICLFPDQGLLNPFTTLLWPGKDVTLKSDSGSGDGKLPNLVVKSVEIVPGDTKTSLGIRLLNQGAATKQPSRTAVIRVSSNGMARLLALVEMPSLGRNESRVIWHDIEKLNADCRLVFLANAPQPGHPWGALREFKPLNAAAETLDLALPTFSNNAFAIRYHAEPGEQAFQNQSVN